MLQELVVLHVAMFSDTYSPYVSGAVRSIERLSEALRKRGHVVTVVGPHYWGYQDTQGCGIRRCPSLPIYPPGNIVLALPQLGSIVRSLKHTGVDVIHSHSPFIMGLTAAEAGRQLHIPVVFTHHSVYHEYAVYAPKPMRRQTERVIFNWVNRYVHRVNAVVAPSNNTRDFIRSNYGVDAVVISNPISAPGVVANLAHSFEGQPVLLFVGRLGKEKNIPLLIHALAHIKTRTNAQLVLVGDGPERGNLERLASELGVRNRLTIAGFLPYEDVSEWYRKATLFVFSSYIETQGMVMLEALGHGVPVVAVESEASRAALDMCQAGRVVAAKPEPMGQAILELLGDDVQLKQMGERGCTYAKTFTAAGVAEQMEKLYHSLLVSR